MYNASAYAAEEKLSLTKVAAILEEANTACFTVCYRCKVDDKVVKEKMQAVTKADLSDKAKLKQLSKELMEGKESKNVGHLIGAKKLGRSSIIDLPSGGFRQVDHRTL